MISSMDRLLRSAPAKLVASLADVCDPVTGGVQAPSERLLEETASNESSSSAVDDNLD